MSLVSSSGSGCLHGTVTQGPSQWSGLVWVGCALVLLQKTKPAPRPGQVSTTPAVLLLGTASPVTPCCTADCRAPTCPCHCTERLGCLSRILGGGASTYPWKPLASGYLGPSLPMAWMNPHTHQLKLSRGQDTLPALLPSGKPRPQLSWRLCPPVPLHGSPERV